MYLVLLVPVGIYLLSRSFRPSAGLCCSGKGCCRRLHSFYRVLRFCWCCWFHIVCLVPQVGPQGPQVLLVPHVLQVIVVGREAWVLESWSAGKPRVLESWLAGKPRVLESWLAGKPRVLESWLAGEPLGSAGKPMVGWRATWLAGEPLGSAGKPMVGWRATWLAGEPLGWLESHLVGWRATWLAGEPLGWLESHWESV